MKNQVPPDMIDRALRIPIEQVMNLDALRKATSREYKGACPFCGGDDRFSVQVRADRADTWLCRHCSPSYRTIISLVMRWRFNGLPKQDQFLSALEFLLHEKLPTIPTSSIKETVKGNAEKWECPSWINMDLLPLYESHPDRFSAWANHKGITEEEVRARRYGVGVLPRSRCNHDRLIVPVFENGVLVGLRGRQLNCRCGRRKKDGTFAPDKWLNSKGSKKALYGMDDLSPNGNQVVLIIENNIDTNLIRREGWVALAATTGVATVWEEEWIERLRIARPSQIVIAFDNGVEGCPSDALLRQWEEANPGRTPPLNGRKLQRQLAKHKVYPRLWKWMDDAPQGADWGWYYAR